MKYSCKATPRDEKQLWKNESKIIFRYLVRALWKCTESSIEIMQISYVLADFELSYFFQNKNSQKLLNIIFENDSPKRSFWENKKKSWIFASVAGFSKITDNLS